MKRYQIVLCAIATAATVAAFWCGQFTNSLAHALLLLIRFSLKYRIVEFNIRKEPLDCADCHDDNCPSRIRENCEWS